MNSSQTYKTCTQEFIDKQHNVKVLHEYSMQDGIHTVYGYGHKLPIMALIRNLRNIVEADVSISHINKIIELMADKNVIANSKLMPFRFLAAYKELSQVNGSRSKINALLGALEEAVKLSACNLPFNDTDNMLIVSDVSGSMFSPVSEKSKITLYDIGVLLSMIYKFKARYVETGIFGDSFMTYSFPGNNILANTEDLRKIEGKVGYSTNGYLVIEHACKTAEKFDRIMIFTDCQFNESQISALWKQYKRNVHPTAKLYLFNLAGYGKIPLQIKDDVHLISGFNEQIFNSFDIIDNKSKILNDIENITL